MKKLLSILLAVIMIVGMITMSAITAFAAELPTVEIGTGNELIAFMNHVNNGDYDNGVNAILTADIDISMTAGLSDFDNVGYDEDGYFSLTRGIGYDSNHPFKGIFDGNGHYINYFYDCDVEESLIHSLFAVNEGTIKNLTVGIPGDPDNTGSFYAVNVRECHTAGVCGVNKGTIDGCANYLDVRGINVVGGIAAYNEGTVINCLNYNRVMGSSDNSFVGGMVGKQDGGRVYNCANYGEVLVDYYTGTNAGIVGCSNGGEVSSCFVGGTVSGHDPHTVVGKNNGAIVTENYYEIKDGLPADNNAEGIEKALIDSGYAVSLLREAAKNIAGAKMWFIGADGYPAFVGSDVPRFLTPSISCTVDENGVLTVVGTGVIPANAFANDNTIKEAVLGEGITSVGANAFAGCANLHTITVKGQSITFENGVFSGITGANAFTVEKSDGTKTDTIGNAIINTLSGNIEAVYIHRFDRTRDVVTAPACTVEGYTTHYCRDCDYSYTDTITETTGHHYTQKRLANKVVAPTCTEKGSITHYCDDCDASYTEETAATGHYFDKNGKCIKCSATYSANNIGGDTVHFVGTKQIYLEITYHVPYYRSSATRSVASSKGSKVYGFQSETPKTFTLNGEWVKSSIFCEEAFSSYVFPIYSELAITVQPTCTEEGYTEYTYCGETYRMGFVPATGHHYTGKRLADEVVAPTCTKNGGIIHYCDDCDYSYTEVVPATGHHYTGKRLADEVVAPTCTEKGGIIHYCDDCDYSYTEETAAAGHYFDKNGKCTKCSKDYSTMVFGQSETVHFEGAKQIYLTVTGEFPSNTRTTGNILRGSNCDQQFEVQGKTETKFMVDGDWLSYSLNAGFTYEITVIPVYDDNIITVEPTACSQDGYKEISYCGKTYRETIPAAEHHFDKNGKCAECGKPFSLADYSKGSTGYDKTLVFSGADSITVKFKNLDNNKHLHVYDGSGNEVATASYHWNNLTNGAVTVPGDTVRIAYPEGAGTFEIASITPNYSSDTASVLSDGNLWIILVVAVLAIGGIAALVIVKKKKKPAAAGVAADEEE